MAVPLVVTGVASAVVVLLVAVAPAFLPWKVLVVLPVAVPMEVALMYLRFPQAAPICLRHQAGREQTIPPARVREGARCLPCRARTGVNFLTRRAPTGTMARSWAFTDFLRQGRARSVIGSSVL